MNKNIRDVIVDVPSDRDVRSFPYRTWSLFEIMKLIDGAYFMQIRGFLRNYQFYDNMGEFYNVLSKIPFIGKSIQKKAEKLEWLGGGRGNIINKHSREIYDGVYTDLNTRCIELGLIGSSATIDKMLKCVATETSTYDEFYKLGDELEGRLLDEMKKRHFISMTLNEAEYYSQPQKGWEDIIKHFPNTVSDIEEARKCFALGRYAASVFHSLQVVEIGIIELGKTIKVTDHLPGWTATTSALKKVTEKKYSDKTDFEKKHSSFLEQIYALTESLKNAWRNKVSHANGRLVLMTSDFSPDIAEEILFASRSFMRRLATEWG